MSGERAEVPILRGLQACIEPGAGNFKYKLEKIAPLPCVMELMSASNSAKREAHNLFETMDIYHLCDSFPKMGRQHRACEVTKS